MVLDQHAQTLTHHQLIVNNQNSDFYRRRLHDNPGRQGVEVIHSDYGVGGFCWQ
jgi:hypothetical protein